MHLFSISSSLKEHFVTDNLHKTFKLKVNIGYKYVP